MKRGRLARQGGPGEITRNAVLSEIFDFHVRVEAISDYPIGVYFS